jgi:hypothetical protein
MKILAELQTFEIGKSHSFPVSQGPHQCRGQIATSNAAAAYGHLLRVHDAARRVTAVVTLQRRAANITRQVNAKALERGNSVGNQDESHSCFLRLNAPFVNAAAMSAGTQRDRRHQTGNASTKNRYFHLLLPEEYRSVTGRTDFLCSQFSILTTASHWACLECRSGQLVTPNDGTFQARLNSCKSNNQEMFRQQMNMRFSLCIRLEQETFLPGHDAQQIHHLFGYVG